MIVLLVLTATLVAGILTSSRWALLLPLGIGAFVALIIVVRRSSLGDTPIPFLVVVCTLVMIGGQALRSRFVSPVT